jgi:acetyl esterase/lipase
VASRLFGPQRGLPPLLIQVGSVELLLSDSERLAEAAREAGVDVALSIGQDRPHVYQGALTTRDNRGERGNRRLRQAPPSCLPTARPLTAKHGQP